VTQLKPQLEGQQLYQSDNQLELLGELFAFDLFSSFVLLIWKVFEVAQLA
jgi:hypothetical protein